LHPHFRSAHRCIPTSAPLLPKGIRHLQVVIGKGASPTCTVCWEILEILPLPNGKQPWSFHGKKKRSPVIIENDVRRAPHFSKNNSHVLILLFTWYGQKSRTLHASRYKLIPQVAATWLIVRTMSFHPLPNRLWGLKTWTGKAFINCPMSRPLEASETSKSVQNLAINGGWREKSHLWPLKNWPRTESLELSS
jgi:hypothetical protein